MAIAAMERQDHSEGQVARAIEQQTAKLPSDTFLWAAVGCGMNLTPIDGNERSFVYALPIITTIAATHYVIVALRQRYPAFGRVVDGTPLVLFQRGRWERETMARNLIPADDVLGVVRG